jgi:hypothetical protein
MEVKTLVFLSPGSRCIVGSILEVQNPKIVNNDSKFDLESYYNHRATPPWWEQVPFLLRLKLYVPSLQTAVAPAGGLL